MKHLRLERSFSGHQSVMIVCFTIVFIVKSYQVFSNNNWSINAIILAIPFIALTILCIGILFMQNGFSSLSKNRVARGWYIYGIPIRFKTIDANKFPVISTLKMGKTQKLAWTLAANPDLSTSYTSFDITSLNDKHTKKERLVILKKEQNALKAIEFITTHSSLREEIYSPDFS